MFKALMDGFEDLMLAVTFAEAGEHKSAVGFMEKPPASPKGGASDAGSLLGDAGGSFQEV